jgi:hypothetical protein
VLRKGAVKTALKAKKVAESAREGHINPRQFIYQIFPPVREVVGKKVH